MSEYVEPILRINVLQKIAKNNPLTTIPPSSPSPPPLPPSALLLLLLLLLHLQTSSPSPPLQCLIPLSMTV